MSQGQDTVVGSGLTYEGAPDTASGGAYFEAGANYGTTFLTISGGAGLFTLGENSVVADVATVGSSISLMSNSSVTGGAGSTVTFVNAGGSGTVAGAVGDTISAAGRLTVSNGQDQNISVAGALVFINGTGATTLIGGASSVVYGAQDLNATASLTGYTIFTVNQPGSTGNQSFDASASKANLEYWSGPGQSTFIGGSGDDHFVFGTEFAGTSGDTFVTVTGGAGANSYGVLNGHNGGAVTIMDFNADKGDFIFAYLYKPANPAQAVQDFLASATVAGGNMTLQVDGNMTVTLLDVTQLHASAVIIS